MELSAREKLVRRHERPNEQVPIVEASRALQFVSSGPVGHGQRPANRPIRRHPSDGADLRLQSPIVLNRRFAGQMRSQALAQLVEPTEYRIVTAPPHRRNRRGIGRRRQSRRFGSTHRPAASDHSWSRGRGGFHGAPASREGHRYEPRRLSMCVSATARRGTRNAG